jgi:FkbM family methyltransferase
LTTAPSTTATTASAESAPDVGSPPSTAITWAWLYRTAYAILPLIRVYYPLLQKWGRQGGLLSVPWGKYRLSFPAAWLKAAVAHIYQPPAAINPEFFTVIAPALRSLAAGSIVDVGAHMGVYLLNFRACSEAPIIAFEPEPFTFSLLTHNARSNRLQSVDLRNVACGDSTRAVGLNAGINSNIEAGDSGATPSAAHAIALSVPLVRLDDELRSVDAVSFLKIDCEGYEYEVLAGAREILARHRPVIFLELHPRYIESYGHTLSDVCALLRSHGYALEFWDCDPQERAANPLTRFLGRYTNRCVPLADEAAMLAAVREQPKLVQVFVLGRPGTLITRTVA